MSTISVQDLKARLSSAVAEAEAGETLIITRHNEAGAQLTPVASRHTHRGSRAGIGPAARRHHGRTPGPKDLLLATLLDDRGNR